MRVYYSQWLIKLILLSYIYIVILFNGYQKATEYPKQWKSICTYVLSVSNLNREK